jgi:chemotaxis protein MotA
MAKAAEDEQAFYGVIRVLITAFLKGTAPIMAVEIARRSVPGHVRPSFQEVESACRQTGEATGAAPPAEESANAAGAGG